jgi:hypothetical protein
MSKIKTESDTISSDQLPEESSLSIQMIEWIPTDHGSSPPLLLNKCCIQQQQGD